jgi:hypothetical protein
MKKLIFNIFILVFSGTIVTISNCMLTKTRFKPYIQAHNTALDEWRNSVIYMPTEKIVSSNSRVSIDPEKKYYGIQFRCFQYVIREIIPGFMEHIDFPEENSASITIENFFEQTKQPQPNDLVIYTPSKENLTVQHFAIFINAITFESKWGRRDNIMRHGPFDVPAIYGKAAWCYTLKEKYKKIPEGKIRLRQDVEATIRTKALQLREEREKVGKEILLQQQAHINDVFSILT